MKTSAASVIRYSVGALSLLLSVSALALPILGFWLAENIRFFEFITGLRFQVALLATLALVISLCARMSLPVGIALLAVTFNWAAIVPAYFGKPSPPEEIAALKLISFNVLYDNPRHDEVIDYIRSEQPDLVAFQEATGEWPTKLSPLKQDFPYHYSASQMHIEIYSRVPFFDKPELSIIGKVRGIVHLPIEHRGEQVMVLATHAYPQVSLGDEGFRWRNEHLTKVLPEVIERYKDRPTIVIGDLNVSRWSPHFKRMIRSTELKNARQGFGIKPSCGIHLDSTRLLARPLDQCLHNERFITRDFHTGPELGSDHLPILVELILRPTS